MSWSEELWAMAEPLAVQNSRASQIFSSKQALLDDLRGLLTHSDAAKLRQSLQTAQGEAGGPAKRTGKARKRYSKPKGRRKTPSKE
jgi:hypothetical protein